MNDEIDDFFRNLTPGDFDRSTSAVQDAKYSNEVGGKRLFDAFVIQCVDATQLAFYAADQAMQPFAVLHSRGGRRLFVPDEDEDLEMLVSRLQREVEAFDPIWFYIAMIGPGAVADENGEPPLPYGEEDEHRIKPDMAEGVLETMLLWYAEAVDSGLEKVVFGAITIENGRLSESVVDDDEGDPEERGASYMFRRVMASRRAAQGRRLVVNPDPLKVVKERHPGAALAGWNPTREHRRKLWIATGGKPEEFDETYPED